MDKQLKESIGKKWDDLSIETLKHMCFLLESERNSFKSENKRLNGFISELRQRVKNRECCGNCILFEAIYPGGVYVYGCMKTRKMVKPSGYCKSHTPDNLTEEQRGE